MSRIQGMSSVPQDYRMTVTYLQVLELLQAKFSHYAVTYAHQSLLNFWLVIDLFLSSSDRLNI